MVMFKTIPSRETHLNKYIHVIYVYISTYMYLDLYCIYVCILYMFLIETSTAQIHTRSEKSALSGA